MSDEKYHLSCGCLKTLSEAPFHDGWLSSDRMCPTHGRQKVVDPPEVVTTKEGTVTKTVVTRSCGCHTTTYSDSNPDPEAVKMSGFSGGTCMRHRLVARL